MPGVGLVSSLKSNLPALRPLPFTCSSSFVFIPRFDNFLRGFFGPCHQFFKDMGRNWIFFFPPQMKSRNKMGFSF